MLNIFLFLSGVFITTFLLGHLLEKIRVPWIFASLLIGIGLAANNPFTEITQSEVFNFLAQMGMFFLLFMVGIEVDLTEMRKKSAFLFKSTFIIILLEAFLGSLLISYLFATEWIISIAVALSFATVGEVVLIPILQEFNIVNTKLGQSILGIGIIDNIIEVIMLIFVAVLITGAETSAIISTISALSLLFIITLLLTKMKREATRFAFMDLETLFLFSLFLFFLFTGIGTFADSSPLAALLAGISIKTFMPKNRLVQFEKEVKTMAYGFFAPIFFLSVGVSVDLHTLLSSPIHIFLIVIISNGAKLLGSYLMGKRELGTRGSLLLGIGLSVRFSTSIVIIKILFDAGIIGIDLYSVIVASSVIFKFIIPVLFSNLLLRWGFTQKTEKSFPQPIKIAG